MLMWGDVFTFFPAPTFLSRRRAVRNSPTLERTAIHSICGFENAKYKTWQKQQKKSNGNVGWCCVKNKITETISKIEYHNRINAMKLEWAVASSLRENALKSQHRATLHLTGLNLRVLKHITCHQRAWNWFHWFSREGPSVRNSQQLPLTPRPAPKNRR